VSLSDCKFTDNAQFGVESNYQGSVLQLCSCSISKNAAGDRDDWAGGVIEDVPVEQVNV